MIYAVIITYNPDLANVAKLLYKLQSQVDHVVVVDNASSCATVIELDQLLLPLCCTLVKNDSNLGIAEALTQGVAFSRQRQARYVLLLDQDSLPADNMVVYLRQALETQLQLGERVAAVGPSYVDIKGQFNSPFVKLQGLSLTRVDCPEHEVVAVDHLITSGSLVYLDALIDIGDMEGKLFIDYVDTEWCLRAKAKGYQIYGVADAKMSHDLGDGVASFMGRKLPVHSPLRYYYLIRNGVWVLRQPWVGMKWRLMDIRRLFLIYLVYSVFVGDRVNNWKMMTRGLWHGLTGKMGKYEQR